MAFVSLDEANAKIAEALQNIHDLGQIQGDHHRAWVLDYTVRILTNCPLIKVNAVCQSTGEPYEYETYGESDEYNKFVDHFGGGYYRGIAP